MAPLLTKDVLSSAIITPGAQSVMTSGALLMQMLCVVNLAIRIKVKLDYRMCFKLFEFV